MFTVLLAVIVISSAEALVVYGTWNWFIVPFGVMAISYPQMIGIQLMIRFFKPKKIEKEELLETTAAVWLISGVIFGLSFWLSRFM